MARVVLAEMARAETALLAAALEGAGHTVIMAESVEAALSQADRADVLLADVALPPDGLQALMDGLGTGDRSAGPAVLVLCEAGAVGEARDALQKGARDYCLRPLQLERLLAKVDLAARSVQQAAPLPAGPSPGTERRLTPRRKASSPLQVVIDGITMDISEGGMRIAAPVQMNDELVISVVSEFIAQLTGLKGHVVQCRIVHHKRLNGKFAYGVSFIELDDTVKAAIRKWVSG